MHARTGDVAKLMAQLGDLIYARFSKQLTCKRCVDVVRSVWGPRKWPGRLPSPYRPTILLSAKAAMGGVWARLRCMATLRRRGKVGFSDPFINSNRSSSRKHKMLSRKTKKIPKAVACMRIAGR